MKVWIIGASSMAIEYSKVLKALNVDFTVIGRGENSAASFLDKTGVQPFIGGLEKFVSTNPALPTHVIVAVGVEQLCPTAKLLIKYGVKNILLEKPGGLNLEEMKETAIQAENADANVYVAYNRRFYSSVLKAEGIIDKDGGVTSFNFEFTEWAHTIHPDHRPIKLFNNWLLANSTHVIDTAFFLGGEPVEMSCYSAGKDGIDWHPSACVYAGAGMSNKGALFSYQANWKAPGRWVIEMLTNKHRLYFKPMETLQIQEIGSVKVEPVQIDDHLDKEFKAGFYLQTKSFLENDFSRFCSIDDQVDRCIKYYNKIANN